MRKVNNKNNFKARTIRGAMIAAFSMTIANGQYY